MLIHGGRDHARNWDAVAEALVDRYTLFAPDLRGHGDSAWAIGSQYSMPEFVLDIETLVEEIGGPVEIMGHSLGGAIGLQYTGVCPDKVTKVVAIEGWGPRMIERRPAHLRMREWIAHSHQLEQRQPRRYPDIESAVKRMEEENPHLTHEMARHLTIHGSRRNEDGTYTWKFDNFVRIHSPYEFNIEDARAIWNQIKCPVLLIRGTESWASDPEEDGRADAFHDHQVVTIQDAGHWVHHDQLDPFIKVARAFLLGE